MNVALVAAITIAMIAIVTALVAIARGGRGRGDDLSGLVQQIDTVRGELRDLSNLFLVPRTRGAVGETILAELLAAWLPASAFELQHGFANGTRVDAVVRLGDRLVSIDSKFPLESVQRYFGEGSGGPLPADVRKAFRKHIGDIAERYIAPNEGTMSFALMYVPAERVYVELFANDQPELLREALERNVVPVSPSTLFLYLQTVAYGLRGLAIPERTRHLLDDLGTLRAELTGFARSFEVAGGHLRNLTRAYDEAAAKLARVSSRVERLGDEEER